MKLIVNASYATVVCRLRRLLLTQIEHALPIPARSVVHTVLAFLA